MTSEIAEILDNELFPYYVEAPTNEWLQRCDESRELTTMYSEEFLNTFATSEFARGCWWAKTESANCPEGWVSSRPYNFYKVISMFLSM